MNVCVFFCVFKSCLCNCKMLYLKEVDADSANLDEFQQRLVSMYLMEFRLNGMELTGDDSKTFVEFLGKLVDAKTHFRLAGHQ